MSSKFTKGDPYGNAISTSAWVLYCKFAADLQNTSRGPLLCFISFALMQVINKTFYSLAFIIHRPEFVE